MCLSTPAKLVFSCFAKFFARPLGVQIFILLGTWMVSSVVCRIPGVKIRWIWQIFGRETGGLKVVFPGSTNYNKSHQWKSLYYLKDYLLRLTYNYANVTGFFKKKGTLSRDFWLQVFIHVTSAHRLSHWRRSNFFENLRRYLKAPVAKGKIWFFSESECFFLGE
jgi:hypothetical protein